MEKKGYFVSDEYLKKQKDYDKLEELYRSNPLIFGVIFNELKLSLFQYRHKNFEILCSNPDIKNFFHRIIFQNTRFHEIYSNAYSLDDFLRNVFVSLIISGKVFFKIDWTKNEDKIGDVHIPESIRWLAVETMNVIHNNVIQGFRQEYSNYCNYNDLRGVKIDFSIDEVFYLEWIFNGETNKGVSPLKELIPYHKEMMNFLDYMKLSSYAMSHPEDRSNAVERARYTPWNVAKKKNDQAEMKIRTILGVMPKAPMTTYYDIYQFIEFKKRLAKIREYLLKEFNTQILRRICQKNGFSEIAEIRLVGYPSIQEIETLFEKFTKKEILNKEVVDSLINF